MHNILEIDENKFPIVSAAKNKRLSLVEKQFENLSADEDAVSAIVEKAHNEFFHNDLTESDFKDQFDFRHKTKNADGSVTHVGKRHEDGSFFVLDHESPKSEGGVHRFELKRFTKDGDVGGRAIGLDKDPKKALEKAIAARISVKGLNEAEAPNYRPDRLMSMSNPIASTDFQDFSPNQFSAGNVQKAPTRLADQNSALQKFPLEQRQQQLSDEKQVAPSQLPPQMSVDWHADIPEKFLDSDFDIDLQPEEEVFPIFNQYRDQAWIQSGPPSALVAGEIMEPGTMLTEEDDDFDYSYKENPIFKKNFSGNPTHEHRSVYGTEHHHKIKDQDGTIHNVVIRRMNNPPESDKYYSADVYSDAPENNMLRRIGYGTGKTSGEAISAAHEHYKRNLKVPSYMQEQHLYELSKDTMKRYVRKAVDDLADSSRVLGAEHNKFPRLSDAAKQVIGRRKIGINTAARKLSEKVDKFQPLGNEIDSNLDEDELPRFRVTTKKYDTHTFVRAKNEEDAKRKAASRYGSAFEGSDVTARPAENLKEENLDEAFFDPNGKSLEVLLNTHSRNCAGGSDHCRDVTRQIEDYVKSHHGKDAHDNMRAYSALMALSKKEPKSLVGSLRAKDQTEKFRDAFFRAAENHLHAKKRVG